jgi:SAM-dependent methyltransferase
VSKVNQTAQRTLTTGRERWDSSVVAAVRRQAAYSTDAELYESRSELFHRWRRRVVELLPLRPGDVVLDVGCGTGRCFQLLLERIGAGGTILGLDASAEMLALARRHIAANGWRNVVLIDAAAEDAIIPQVADHAVFCAVHDILQSPQALSNVLARLRVGGWVASVGGKWAPPWAIGLNTMVAAMHAPFVRNFAGFDRPWALLTKHLTDLHIEQIEMSCGYLTVGRNPQKPGAKERGADLPIPRSRTPGPHALMS